MTAERLSDEELRSNLSEFAASLRRMRNGHKAETGGAHAVAASVYESVLSDMYAWTNGEFGDGPKGGAQ